MIYVVLGLIVLVYFIPIVYICRNRNFAETRARSPYTTMICIFFIMLDSTFNTWIFSIDTSKGDIQNKRHTKCLLGVLVTMLFMVPILLTIYIRIYRVKRVFELYEKYLKIKSIRTPSLISTFSLHSRRLTNANSPRKGGVTNAV